MLSQEANLQRKSVFQIILSTYEREK